MQRDKALLERTNRRRLEHISHRLRRLGLSEEEANQQAWAVLERFLERTKVPALDSERDFSQLVDVICRRLVAGASYYRLIQEMPFLASARIDRVLAAAPWVKPPLDESLVKGARRSSRVERLSGSLAVFFMGLALGAFGLWWALAAGVVVAAAAEVYLQTLMPPEWRQRVAEVRLPVIAYVLAALSVLSFAYQWISGTRPHTGEILLAGLSVILVAFLVPGLTLAFLIGWDTRKWLREEERRIVRRDGPEDRGDC